MGARKTGFARSSSPLEIGPVVVLPHSCRVQVFQMDKSRLPGWLKNLLAKGRVSQRSCATPRQRRMNRRMPMIEELEARVVPAFDLTIGSGAMPTTGVSITANAGTITFVAVAPKAFLNIASIATALGSENVVVESGLSGTNAGPLIVNANVTITALAGSLVFESGTSITVSTGSAITDTLSTLTFDTGMAGGNGSVLIQGTLLCGPVPGQQGSPPPATVPLIQGSGGSTSVFIDYTNGASLPGGLSYVGSAGQSNSLTITDSGDSSGSHSYVLNPTSASRDGGAPVTITNVTQVTVMGGNLNDTFNISTVTSLPPATPSIKFTVNGGGGFNVLNLDQAAPVGTFPGGIALNGTRLVSYTNITGINLLNPAGVDALSGPNFAVRFTAFQGLGPDERFVQALYLAALGRAGSKRELDSWVGIFRIKSLTRTQAQRLIASNIERSLEAREYLVNSCGIL